MYWLRQEGGESLAHFILYGTSACHLCDTAEHLLRAQLATAATAGGTHTYTKTDISDCDALFERYGVRIPVLRHPDGRELDWPFDAAQLAGFLAC